MKNQGKSELLVINPNAAGIDIASREHYVAVPSDRDDTPIRKFGSFTEDLHELALWLKKCGITTVAMESTGIYWIQLYLVLEEYGFDVYLVNARHVKNVTGRKSDVLDCQWIQQLHSFGLLSKSFQPESNIRELRAYMRHRKTLTESASMQILLIQKAFEQMNIKLTNVLTDITGKSGKLIIQAILAGERNPEILISYVDHQVKSSIEEIKKSLVGNWRNEHLFELKQSYELYLIFRGKIEECDSQIENVLSALNVKEQNADSDKNSPRKIYTKNRFNFNATQYLSNILGVEVTKIFGISEILATQIISETGLEMSKWPSKKHFTSWLNLVPNNRISGGKQLRSKKMTKNNKAGQAFLMAANAVKRSDHWLGSFYRRIKSKHGPMIATKATARKIATIFYTMVKNHVEFSPIEINEYDKSFHDKKIKYIKSQAIKLGLKVVEVSVS